MVEKDQNIECILQFSGYHLFFIALPTDANMDFINNQEFREHTSREPIHNKEEGTMPPILKRFMTPQRAACLHGFFTYLSLQLVLVI